jgi:hypothetical protein
MVSTPKVQGKRACHAVPNAMADLLLLRHGADHIASGIVGQAHRLALKSGPSIGKRNACPTKGNTEKTINQVSGLKEYCPPDL